MEVTPLSLLMLIQSLLAIFRLKSVGSTHSCGFSKSSISSRKEICAYFQKSHLTSKLQVSVLYYKEQILMGITHLECSHSWGKILVRVFQLKFDLFIVFHLKNKMMSQQRSTKLNLLNEYMQSKTVRILLLEEGAAGVLSLRSIGSRFSGSLSFYSCLNCSQVS